MTVDGAEIRARLDAEDALLGSDGARRFHELERRCRIENDLRALGVDTTLSPVRQRRAARAAIMRCFSVRNWRDATAAIWSMFPEDATDLQGVLVHLGWFELLEFAEGPRREPALPIAASSSKPEAVSALPPTMETDEELPLPILKRLEDSIPEEWRGWRGGTDDPRAPWNARWRPREW